jgi:hypothetical protein
MVDSEPIIYYGEIKCGLGLSQTDNACASGVVDRQLLLRSSNCAELAEMDNFITA